MPAIAHILHPFPFYLLILCESVYCVHKKYRPANTVTGDE